MNSKDNKFTPDAYVTDIIVASWNKKSKDFDLILTKRTKMVEKSGYLRCGDKFILPGGYIFVADGETAVDAARRITKEVLGVDIVMFRHIAVFDSPKRDPRGVVVSNVMLAIVEDFEVITMSNDDIYKPSIFCLQEIENMNIAFDHKEIIAKFKKLIDYDIYCQIFDTKKFGSDFIVSLLGQKFTTSELIDLAKWSGRRENKTTFYRNIDNNYKFLKKVGRNKYYTKK